MFRLTIRVAPVLALALAGCAFLSKSPSMERLPDGTFRLKCPSSLAQCLVQADDICHGNRFKILAAVDRRDYMGPQSTAGEHEMRSSEAIIQCGKRGKSLFGEDDAKVTAPTACADSAKPDAAAAAPSPAASCTPGTTQECVGPGACHGGQACLPGGAGYTACDCGSGAATPTTLGADAGTPAATGPAAAPKPPATVPVPTPGPARPK